jgi:DNA/RNA endonuclease YhcR with UshA esterase domain
LDKATDLKILKKATAKNSLQKKEMSPANAVKLSNDSRVNIRGAVAYVKKPAEGSKAPFRIMMEGDGELIQLSCWPKTFLQIPESQQPNKGAIIKASVTVKSYKGKKQLKLARGSDYSLEKKGAGGSGNSKNNFGIIPLSDLKSIKNVADRKLVRVDGKVKNIIESDVKNIPFRIILEDETGVLTIVVWPDVWETLSDSQKPKIGDSISINGLASTYKETKQIRVKFAKDIKIK